MSTRVLTVLLVMGMSLPGVAGAGLALTEAVDRALARNHDLAAQGHALDAAVWAHRQAKAQLLPSFYFQSSYTRLDEETVRRANAFGREITFFFPDSTGEFQAETVEIPQTVFRNGYETSISAQMLLLSPAVWNGVSLTSASKDAAYWNKEAERQETVHRTLTSFLELLKARSLVSVQEGYVDLARGNAAQAERLYNVGRNSEADLLRWRVEEARQTGALSRARSAEKVAALTLQNVLGAEPRETIEADTLLPPSLAGEIRRFRAWADEEWDRFEETPLDEVISANPTLRVLGSTQRIAQIENRQSVTNFLPTISLNGSYGWQTNDTWEADGEKAWSATAALTLPIFTSFSNYSALQVTRARVEKAQEDDEAGRRALLLQAEAARTSIRSNAEQLRLARSSLESARRNQEIRRNSYALGRLTNLEWIDANLALQEAERTHTSAYYDLIIAIADYYRARGEIFDLVNDPGSMRAKE